MERRPPVRPASRARLACLAGALVLLGAPRANAQKPDASSAFDYGLAEMLAGRYATGCPALESSFRLDPRPGTLFTLADCDRKWGKSASALARFDEYLALYERMPAEQRTKQRERAAAAASERAALEKSVPLLAVRLPADAPAGTRVWRDDVELTEGGLAAAVPVDPGEHRVRIQLADGRTKEERVSLANGEQRTLTADLAPETGPALVAPPPPPSPPATAAPTTAANAPREAPVEAKRPTRTPWIVASAGVGVAALVVAGVTGGIALGQRSIASPVCDARGECTTQAGANAGNLAHSMADVETGALVVAGVALVATLALWLTEPRAAARAHATRLRPAGNVARWEW